MRLNSLRLQPYGSLSDAALELGEGLTVVYGLNEAGKVPCCPPTLTCCAESRDRRRWPSWRSDPNSVFGPVSRWTPGPHGRGDPHVKNEPNYLLDAAMSAPVSAEVRRALTQALDRDSLLTRFGLNHDRLVTGGRKLMEGHGDLADIVFEAQAAPTCACWWIGSTAMRLSSTRRAATPNRL